MASTSESLPNLVKQVAYYHSLGLTHKDIHRCFFSTEIFDNIDWIRVIGKIVEKEKFEKILKKSTELSFAQFCGQFSRVHIAGYPLGCILYTDENFPSLLKYIHNPPAILYFVGNFSYESLPISIVGSRDCSPSWESITRAFVRWLSKNKVSIISGWALGIDAVAHSAALDCGIHTVAILGSAIDCLYPASNEWLFNTIVTRWWAVVSHFPLGTKAAQYTFPIRNELIAGWSIGTLVTEARERSGSLITAGLALDAGRLVFAIPSDPGRVNARGGNILIRDSGAKCVLSADDVYSECYESAQLYHPSVFITGGNEKNHQWNTWELKTGQSSIERRVWEILGIQSFSLEQISEQTWIPLSELLVPLGKMEILGTIKRDDFWNYHQTWQ
jgi:DNA processing protein